MAIMIPSSPRECKEESLEKYIFECLSKLPDEYYVFHSFSTLQIKEGVLEEHETDFVIFNKYYGVLCIEAKAGHVYFDHEWKYSNGDVMKHGGPFRQADDNKWRLFHAAEECEAIKHFYKKCAYRFGVCFPSLTKDDVDELTFSLEARKELVINKTDLETNPVKKIEAIMTMPLEYKTNKTLTDEEANLFLSEFLCPEADVVPTTTIELDSKRSLFSRLLRDQAMVLDFLDEQDSVVINGAAGTGKTLVAIEKAKRLASNKEKVLFLCYNSELKEYLEKTYSNTYINFYTLAGFVTKLTKSSGDDYEEAAELLLEYTDKPNDFEYRHIIIDEGQDFGIYDETDANESSKELILQALHDIVINNEIGNFYVFYDRLQLIQATHMPEFILNADCKLTLHKNCRNTENIAKASLKTVSEEDKMKRLKFMDGINIGEEARFHFMNKVNKESFQKSLNQIITALKTFGLTNKDIVILSCKSEKDNLLSSYKLLDYKGDYLFEDEPIKFSTCRKFKGLEADAIILVDVDKNTFTSKTGKLIYYVGTSRARIQLDILSALTNEECTELLTEAFEYKRKIKNPKRDLATVLKCHEYIEDN